MAKKPVMLDESDLKAIARYEKTIENFLPDGRLSGEFVILESYQITLDDLYTAFKNILNKNPLLETVQAFWYKPIFDMWKPFGLDKFLGNELLDQPKFSSLPENENDVFCDIWASLDMQFKNAKDQERVSDSSNFLNYMTAIEFLPINMKLPLEERTFTTLQMEHYIQPFSDEKRVMAASESELALCRKFIDKLLPAQSLPALYIKGYSCYGGNRIYPCDWMQSRDCIQKLFELTDQPEYANTLGYIAYYGRCADGVPDYDQAFRMFAIAASCGLYEGQYKLGDMLAKGYGCVKSPHAAMELYRQVYVETLQDFEEGGHDGKFADAALRSGLVFLNGIGTDPSPVIAYTFLLQADFAIRLRMKNDEIYGDNAVAASIRKNLEQAKKQLPSGFRSSSSVTADPYPVLDMVRDNCLARITFKKKKNGNGALTIKRITKKRGEPPHPILFTSPQLDYCDLLESISIEAIGATADFERITARAIHWDADQQKMMILSDGDYQVSILSAAGFRFKKPRKKKESTYRMVSVVFSEGGKEYDYLCDIEGICEGDTVVVETSHGETDVTVAGVYNATEDELTLPIERYKKILRKKAGMNH